MIAGDGAEGDDTGGRLIGTHQGNIQDAAAPFVAVLLETVLVLSVSFPPLL